MQTHAFEVSTAHFKRRPIYNPFKNVVQPRSPYPIFSLVVSDFGVEIGASPTYEVMPCDGLDRPDPADTENTSTRRNS
jgi:hypothetical protein